MQGHEAFQKAVTDSGLSLKDIAAQSGYVEKTLRNYEQGILSLENVSVKRIIKLFSVLGIDIPTFFEEYYSIKADFENDLRQWHETHSKELEYSVVRKRFYDRIKQFKYRKRFPEEVQEELEQLFEDNFSTLSQKLVNEDRLFMQEEEYQTFVKPIEVYIKQLFNDKPVGRSEQMIYDALICSDYNTGTLFNDEIANLLGVSEIYLYNLFYGKNNMAFNSIKIKTALKLCYLLGLDFNTVFIE